MVVTTELAQLLDRRVAAIRKTRPDLEPALELQELLIRTDLAAARRPIAQPFALPRDVLHSRIRSGIPLLHDQPITVDVHFAADFFSRLVNVLQQRDDPDTKEQLSALIEAATGGVLDPQQLFTEAFVQHRDHLAELATSAGVDVDLLAALAAQAAAPLLRAFADHLLPLVDRADDGSPDGARWQAGYCPVCGGWPLLAELRGVELAQYLRCSACGSGWRSQRILCPYCANDDFLTLRSLRVEGEQRFRVSVCERCKGYLKIGNAFDPPPAELLALDDLVSMHLDVVAIERDYRRPGGTGFSIELAVPEEEWLAEELA